jgi:Rrf2 family protein
MWLNSTAQTALRAVLHIAEHAGEGSVRVDDIATSLRTPRNYLSKTLHALARAGVLRSARGPKGGFQLADPPSRLVLSRVIGPFTPAGERRCLVGRADCGDAHPCLAHHRWSRVARGVEDFFGETTVADLLAQPSRTRAL